MTPGGSELVRMKGARRGLRARNTIPPQIRGLHKRLAIMLEPVRLNSGILCVCSGQTFI